METVKSVPVYQCANGHVICKDCIKKLNNCPICRNDKALVRILKLEKIVQRLEGIPPENGGPTTVKPNIQKWGMESVRSYGTINGPNQRPHMETPIPEAPIRQVADNQDEEAPRLQRPIEEEWPFLQQRERHENSENRAQASFKIGCFFCFFAVLLPLLLNNEIVWFLLRFLLRLDYGRLVRKWPSLHSRKSNPNPQFLGTAKAYFVCHIGPRLQSSLIYAFIGCS